MNTPTQDRLLLKAKELFPVGTKFTSLFGADDKVIKPMKLFGKQESPYYLGSSGEVYVFGESGESRLIYDNKIWAKTFK